MMNVNADIDRIEQVEQVIVKDIKDIKEFEMSLKDKIKNFIEKEVVAVLEAELKKKLAEGIDKTFELDGYDVTIHAKKAENYEKFDFEEFNVDCEVLGNELKLSIVKK